ncbi:MAG: hypothetical protein L0Z54_06340, partial [Thermoplasmata archaeon]|nr:hypothetical protein [Thermoplasmata archaeon]
MRSYMRGTVAVLGMIVALMTAFVTFGASAQAQSIDISGLQILPDPGYTCENTTIGFNVTNDLGGMADLIRVSLSAKNAAGGVQWQSNITMLADGATSLQSFEWSYPDEGTYDISIVASGMGYVTSEASIYTVLPCAPHISLGAIGFTPSGREPFDEGTVAVEVMNDGHLTAYKTTVAVQVSGPYPDTATEFLGSTVIPLIDRGESDNQEFLWTPISSEGVYNVTAMAISDTGVMVARHAMVVVEFAHPDTVSIIGLRMNPFPARHGLNGELTVALLFRGNWTAMPMNVSAHAHGPFTYDLGNGTVDALEPDGTANVTFAWPADIDPARYNISIAVRGSGTTTMATAGEGIWQLAGAKTFLPSNFRLEIRGLRFEPFPAVPDEDVTISVLLENSGDLEAPPATLTMTAEGPGLAYSSTRTTPAIAASGRSTEEFDWHQPIAPGEYVVRAYLEDGSGAQSIQETFLMMPSANGSAWTHVNGTTVFNYYHYYDNATDTNGTDDHNLTITTEEADPSASGLSDPVVAGGVGVAAGALMSVLIIAFFRHMGGKGSVSSNPFYGGKGERASGIRGHRDVGGYRSVDTDSDGADIAIDEPGVHRGIVSPRDAQTGQASGRMAINKKGLPGKSSTKKDNAASHRSSSDTGLAHVESGSARIDKTPARISTNVSVPKQTQGATFGEKVNAGLQSTASLSGPPHGDLDGDGTNEPLGMAINEKGLPGEKKPKPYGPTNPKRTTDGEPLDDDSDDDGVPEADAAVAGNPIGGLTIKGGKNPKLTGASRASGGEPLDEDSDGDVVSDSEERKGTGGWDLATNKGGIDEEQTRKGWDGKVKGSGVVDEGDASGRRRVEVLKSNKQGDPDANRWKAPELNSNSDKVSENLDFEKGDKPTQEQFGSTIDSPASKIRESPTKASTGKTSVRESPTESSGVRESPTMPRDAASGQATGKRGESNAPRDVATGQSSGKR